MKSLARVLLLLVLASSTARAEWTTNGVPICTAPDRQLNPVITTDGAGGAIIAWVTAPTTNGNVYAQRVGADGTPLWTTDGVLICGFDVITSSVRIVSDGAGGAIIAWTDLRPPHQSEPDIFAQRVNSSGTPQWTADGVSVCSSSLAQGLGVIQENADGGAFFAWVHAQNLDIVAHRVDGTGSPVFPKTNGLVVTACGNAVEPSIAEDGVGGVFIAWSTGGSTADVYIQRLNSDGLQYWAGGGEVVCNWVLEQTKPMVLSDGAEGAYVVWQDYRSQVSVKVYAQRFTATGEKAWGAYPNGMPVCVATGNQSSPKLISDGSDGIISLWTDSRTGSDMYAQRIDAAGNMQWANDGVLFVSAVGSPWSYLADGAGGVIATHAVPNVYDIVAHRFSAAGSALWPGGVTLCNAANNQLSPVLASDGAGGAIVAWVDYRANPSAGDIYAQRVAAGGQIPTAVETPAFAGALDLSANQPNPFNAETAFTLTLGKRSDVTIEVFDVAGHRVRRAAMRDVDAGSRRISFDGKDAAGNALPSGVYFYRVRAAGETLTRKMVIAR